MSPTPRELLQNSELPLTEASLAAAPVGMQKQMIGERLHRQIAEWEPDQAAKLTGMLLEMENKELLRLLNNKNDLMSKAFEAAEVLATPDTVATARPKKRWVPVANPKS